MTSFERVGMIFAVAALYAAFIVASVGYLYVPWKTNHQCVCGRIKAEYTTTAKDPFFPWQERNRDVAERPGAIGI